MPWSRRRFAGALALLAGTVSCSAGPPTPSSYGAKVRFRKGVPLAFPDFELTYLGRRHVEAQPYPRGFDYDDFRVSGGGREIKVSWSAGTGLLGPREFEFGSAKFELELRHHDKLGWLKEDEVVVTRM